MSAEIIRVSALWQKGFNQKDGRAFSWAALDFELWDRGVLWEMLEACI